MELFLYLSQDHIWKSATLVYTCLLKMTLLSLDHWNFTISCLGCTQALLFVAEFFSLHAFSWSCTIRLCSYNLSFAFPREVFLGRCQIIVVEVGDTCEGHLVWPSCWCHPCVIWFVNVEVALYIWNKFPLVIVYNSLYTLLDSICQYLVEEFCIYVYEGY